jgi:N-acetylglucosamine-6-sulfatase
MAAMAAPLIARNALGARSEARPNFLFILIDDLRYNGLGCLGHPFVKTPNIDRIAHEGAIFGNAFCTTPLCSPSRASFMTGRYVRSHRVLGNGDSSAISHQLITWPRVLHDSGYETCFTGKWHMGKDDSPRPGFDRWVCLPGQGVYNDPTFNVDGKRIKESGYISDILTKHALEFLDKRHSKPFVMYLAHKAVHGPFTPAERHKNLFADQPIVRSANAMDNLDGKPVLQRPVAARKGKKGKKGVDSEVAALSVGTSDEAIRNQMRCITAVDEGIGPILKSLEDSKQLDNTFVVLTSDNGYFWGEHHLGDKRWAYEESLRLPMLMRYPKLIQPGSRFSEMVLNVDMAPTMCDLAGARTPKEVQGRSVVPLLNHTAKDWRTAFLSEYFEEEGYPRVPDWQAVRNEHWKYIHYTSLKNMDELYDLQKDSIEMKNLIYDAPSTLSTMQKDLDKFNREIR